MRLKYAFIVASALMAQCLALTEVVAAEPEISTNSIGLKLVKIPAGKFLMGADVDGEVTLQKFPYCDPSWLLCEFPQHEVAITKSFDIGQYEVSLGEFQKFCQDANYRIEAERDSKPSKGYSKNDGLIESRRFRPWDAIGWKIQEDHPAIFVSWNDATMFCDWLSKKEGRTYRLPTEAEWEYSCRAGTNSRYYFGDEPEDLIRFANIADADRKTLSPNAKIGAYGKDGILTGTDIPFPFLSRRDSYIFAAPVGKFKANNFGLYDMHGNAWEWCSDWYGASYYSDSPKEDPTGPSDGSSRVLRGGGFDEPPLGVRCAARSGTDPSSHDYSTSFRVVRVR